MTEEEGLFQAVAARPFGSWLNIQCADFYKSKWTFFKFHCTTVLMGITVHI